jgi:hypothetical protein
LSDQDTIDRVSEPILREYRLAFQGLRDTIRAIPADEWTKGDRPGDVPVRQACHLLGAAEGYAGHRARAGTRFGVPVESFGRIVAVDAYPSREAVLAYLEDVERRIEAWVIEKTRQALSGKKKVHSPLNRVLYLLRHTVVHLAYLRRELYARGIDRPEYGKR